VNVSIVTQEPSPGLDAGSETETGSGDPPTGLGGRDDEVTQGPRLSSLRLAAAVIIAAIVALGALAGWLATRRSRRASSTCEMHFSSRPAASADCQIVATAVTGRASLSRRPRQAGSSGCQYLNLFGRGSMLSCPPTRTHLCFPVVKAGSCLSVNTLGIRQRVRRRRDRRLVPHGLRHTTASLAISAGANVKVVQRLLGHATAALDRYGHLLTMI